MNVKSRAHYEKQRRLAYARDQGRCVVCQHPAATGSIHHRQGRGGPDPHRLSNLITVHGSGTTGCHGRIHANPAWAYENGFMVRRNGVLRPEDIPVQYGTEQIHLTNSWEPR